MTVKHYSELIAWQKAMNIVAAIYKITEAFPRREMYGLTNQIRRAAVSVPSNIAEGQGRTTARDFCHFLGHSYGSLQEVETHLAIAVRLGFVTADDCKSLFDDIAEVARIINGLRKSLSET